MHSSKNWVNPSLENMRAACGTAGNPQRTYSVIQVGGTNGKTSTARMIDALLHAEGFKTGLYTSPELIHPTERIKISGVDISEEDLAAALASAHTAAARIGLTLTEFEEYTLACFIHLRDTGVDFAILEVGMGGRWDATSAADPAVAAITGIGLDHCEFLGDTLEEIAFDKAHIIKPGSSVILGENVQTPQSVLDVFLQRCEGFDLHPRRVTSGTYHLHFDAGAIPDFSPTGQKVSLPTIFDVTTPHATYTDLTLNAPTYQASNIATALFAAEAALGRALDPKRVRTALAQTAFPGRFEIISTNPLIIFDGAHNPQAAHYLAEQIEWLNLPEKPTIAIGVLRDKDAAGIITALAPQASRFIPLTPPGPRALPADELADIIERNSGGTSVCVEWRDRGSSGGSIPAALSSGIGQKPTGRPPEYSYPATAPAANLTEMDALPQLLNVTKSQPLIVTGSLSLYPLVKSLSLLDIFQD